MTITTRRLLIAVGAVLLVGGCGTTRYAHERQMSAKIGAHRQAVWSGVFTEREVLTPLGEKQKRDYAAAVKHHDERYEERLSQAKAETELRMAKARKRFPMNPDAILETIRKRDPLILDAENWFVRWKKENPRPVWRRWRDSEHDTRTVGTWTIRPNKHVYAAGIALMALGVGVIVFSALSVNGIRPRG